MSDSLRPHGLYSPWNSPGWNTGVGSCSLLQGNIPTQELNQGLLHCRWILYQLILYLPEKPLEPSKLPMVWLHFYSLSCNLLPLILGDLIYANFKYHFLASLIHICLPKFYSRTGIKICIIKLY